EVPRLDDAGMHRADRNLMQAPAFVLDEGIGQGVAGRLLCAEWEPSTPNVVIEPRPRVGGLGPAQAEQVMDRPLKPDRRRVPGADARKLAGLAFEADDRNCG